MLPPALEVKNLTVRHDKRQVLRNITFSAERHELITLLGGDPVIRSALFHAITGMNTERDGSIRIHGMEAIHLSVEQIAHLGVGYKTAARASQFELSSEDNLLLPLPGLSASLGGGMSLAEIYDLLPELHDKKNLPVAQLSAGERKMLSIARILRTGANLLLLDELSAGLAPISEVSIKRTLLRLKQSGYTIVMSESDLHFAAHLSDRIYWLETDALSSPSHTLTSPSIDIGYQAVL